MGVGCYCNGNHEIECLMIFGRGIQIKTETDEKITWPQVVTKKDC
jgi:hypothetical protein